MTSDLYSKEEDLGYRRGFDQGVAALAYALGVPNDRLQRTAFKQRVKDFRFGRLKDAPWDATAEEASELRGLIN